MTRELLAPDPRRHRRSSVLKSGRTLATLIAVLGLSACGGVSVEDEPDTVVRAGLVPTFTPLPPPDPTRTPLPRPTATLPWSTATPDEFQRAGLPVRLEIPAIGVDAAIEHVGINSLNQIDVPKIAANVAWFDRSALPGQRGNSVISGHLDTATAPAVFYELRKLIAGDEMVVTYANNDRYVFVVSAKQRYYFDEAPMDQILGAATGRNLNLGVGHYSLKALTPRGNASESACTSRALMPY
jgi:sortase (surface protein transpeptidase)